MFQGEMQEYIKLAGWNSTNYLILKGTVEKFHSKIHKIGKRYKEFLNESMRVQVFDYARNSILSDSFSSFHGKNSDDFTITPRKSYEPEPKVKQIEQEDPRWHLAVKMFSINNFSHELTSDSITTGWMLIEDNIKDIF